MSCVEQFEVSFSGTKREFLFTFGLLLSELHIGMCTAYSMAVIRTNGIGGRRQNYQMGRVD